MKWKMETRPERFFPLLLFSALPFPPAMNVPAFLPSGFVAALALTLLHTLWQGAAVAGLLWAILKTIPAARAKLRYALACAALLTSVTAGGIIFAQCWPAASGTVSQVNPPLSNSASAKQTAPADSVPGRRSGEQEVPGTDNPDKAAGAPEEILPPGIPKQRESFAGAASSTATASSRETPSMLLPAVSDAAEAAHSRNSPVRESSAAAAAAEKDRLSAAPWMPWLTGLWAAGVAIGVLRLTAGWRVLRRWRRQARVCPDDSWNEVFDRQLKQLKISVPVRFLVSAAVPVPMVIGWLRPVVVVPAELLTGLPAGQLEALLLHELAHIRRWDFGVNLLQSVVDVLFFHHPGMRWISSQIRSEREHCCDDMAAGLCGGPLPYARALVSLENLRAGEAPALCTAATGSPLVRRIRRLAAPASSATIFPLWPVLAAMTALGLLSGGLPWLQAQDKPAVSRTEATSPTSLPPNPATAVTPVDQTATTSPSAREMQEAKALETVKAFLQAGSAVEKMRWLLPDEETQAAAQVFYHRHPEAARIMGGTQFGPCLSREDGSVQLAMEVPELEGTFFFPVCHTAGDFRIDWLGSTCYLGQHFEDIRSDLPETPVRIRAILRCGDYYNKAFADKSRYRCYELIYPGVNRKFFGYEPVTGNTQDGRQPDPLTELNLNLRPGIQTLEIKYPPSQKDPSQVEIVRVSAPQPATRSSIPQPRTSELESLRHKTTSQFRDPAVAYDTRGADDTRPASLRDFSTATFDNVTLVPSTVVKPSPEVILRVTDENGGPIPNFRILMGHPQYGGVVAWNSRFPKPYDSQFKWPRKFMNSPGAARIEADGFVPEMRTWDDPAKLPDEIVLALRPDSGTKIRVLLPDGQPANGAAVALVLYGQQAVIANGSLLHAGGPIPETPYAAADRPRFFQTDADGLFRLPQEPDAQALVVIAHPGGVAESSHAVLAKNPEIRLRPWARIQGRVLNPETPGARKAVRFSAKGYLQGTTDMVIQEDHLTVGSDGVFEFEKVLPGMVQMTRMVVDEPFSIENTRLLEPVTPFRAEPGANRVTIEDDRLTLEAQPDDKAPASPQETEPSPILPPPDAGLPLAPDAQPPRAKAGDDKIFDDILLNYPDSPVKTKTFLSPPPTPVIVTEAGTGKRIPSFSVIAGSVRIDDTIAWRQPVEGTDGVVSLDVLLSGQGALRVEADGMIPEVRKWKTFAERPERFSFELKPDPGVRRQVLLPDGSPAAGAAVAVVLEGQGALLLNGQLQSSDRSSILPRNKPPHNARFRRTDDSGEFLLPAEADQTAPVIITHEAGILELPYSKFLAEPQVTLQPWAEIEGRAMWGEISGAGAPIILRVERKPSVGDLLLLSETVTADREGKFIFRKVPPGRVLLGWRLPELGSQREVRHQYGTYWRAGTHRHRHPDRSFLMGGLFTSP